MREPLADIMERENQWVETRDAKTNLLYYYNRQTRVTSWTCPTGAVNIVRRLDDGTTEIVSTAETPPAAEVGEGATSATARLPLKARQANEKEQRCLHDQQQRSSKQAKQRLPRPTRQAPLHPHAENQQAYAGMQQQNQQQQQESAPGIHKVNSRQHEENISASQRIQQLLNNHKLLMKQQPASAINASYLPQADHQHVQQEQTRTGRTAKKNDANVTVAGNAISPAQPSVRETSRPLSKDWVKTEDPVSHKVYYYHRVTRETTWEDPRKRFESESYNNSSVGEEDITNTKINARVPTTSGGGAERGYNTYGVRPTASDDAESQHRSKREELNRMVDGGRGLAVAKEVPTRHTRVKENSPAPSKRMQEQQSHQRQDRDDTIDGSRVHDKTKGDRVLKTAWDEGTEASPGTIRQHLSLLKQRRNRKPPVLRKRPQQQKHRQNQVECLRNSSCTCDMCRDSTNGAVCPVVSSGNPEKGTQRGKKFQQPTRDRIRKQAQSQTRTNKSGSGKSSKWKRQSEQLRRAMQSARVAGKNQSGAGKRAVKAPRQQDGNNQVSSTGYSSETESSGNMHSSAVDDDGLVPCPHCNRRFNEKAAERHIPKCRDIKAKPKTLRRGQGSAAGAAGARKMRNGPSEQPRRRPASSTGTARSNNSRTRRVSTTRPTTTTATKRTDRTNRTNRTSGGQSGVKTTSRMYRKQTSIPCPHCHRTFHERAAERHIEHCAKIKAKPLPPPHRRKKKDTVNLSFEAADSDGYHYLGEPQHGGENGTSTRPSYGRDTGGDYRRQSQQHTNATAYADEQERWDNRDWNDDSGHSSYSRGVPNNESNSRFHYREREQRNNNNNNAANTAYDFDGYDDEYDYESDNQSPPPAASGGGGSAAAHGADYYAEMRSALGKSTYMDPLQNVPGGERHHQMSTSNAHRRQSHMGSARKYNNASTRVMTGRAGGDMYENDRGCNATTNGQQHNNYVNEERGAALRRNAGQHRPRRHRASLGGHEYINSTTISMDGTHAGGGGGLPGGMQGGIGTPIGTRISANEIFNEIRRELSKSMNQADLRNAYA